MSEWKAKRFWSEANVVACLGGYTVHLDTRPVRTPAKKPLVVPTQALAKAMAAEWQAQNKTVDPQSMPVTRAANSAIDKVVPMRAEVTAMLAEYGDADMTCYRAAEPDGLVARQSAAWDPLLDWAAETHRARLMPVVGVVHQAQSVESLARLAAPMRAMSAFQLAGFHDLVTLSGSLVIANATIDGFLPPLAMWQRSRIDEDWQVEQWGVDDEAAALAQSRQAGFLNATKFYWLSTKNS